MRSSSSGRVPHPGVAEGEAPRKRLRPYADALPLRLRQMSLDAAVLVWCALATRAAVLVYAAVLRLQQPGRQLRSAGDRLAGGLGDAADQLSNTPILGDRLRDPLSRAARTSRSVADAAEASQAVVAHSALALAIAVAVIPSAWVLMRWLPHRVRYARDAAALVALADDVELLALRAATTLPLSRLARLGPEPVNRWRRGEPGAAHALAALQLEAFGIIRDRPVANT